MPMPKAVRPELAEGSTAWFLEQYSDLIHPLINLCHRWIAFATASAASRFC